MATWRRIARLAIAVESCRLQDGWRGAGEHAGRRPAGRDSHGPGLSLSNVSPSQTI